MKRYQSEAIPCLIPPDGDFAELKKWLESFPDQGLGLMSAICETGEPYVEFSETGLCREPDVAVIERHVALRMARKLAKYLESRSGRIYWRVCFESEINTTPDDWREVSCYCRLYRASYSCGLFHEAKVA